MESVILECHFNSLKLDLFYFMLFYLLLWNLPKRFGAQRLAVHFYHCTVDKREGVDCMHTQLLTLTWESISDRRRFWPSPTLGAGAHHQGSHKKTVEGAEVRHLLSPCQTRSHRKQLPAAGRLGTNVHVHGGGLVTRHSRRQCWPVIKTHIIKGKAPALGVCTVAYT